MREVAQVAQIVTTLSYHSYAEHYTQLGDQPPVSQFPAYGANTASTTTWLTLWIESCSHKALGLILVLLLDWHAGCVRHSANKHHQGK